jgi:hypothetical protein
MMRRALEMQRSMGLGGLQGLAPPGAQPRAPPAGNNAPAGNPWAGVFQAPVAQNYDAELAQMRSMGFHDASVAHPCPSRRSYLCVDNLCSETTDGFSGMSSVRHSLTFVFFSFSFSTQEAANLAALRATGGNVSAAVDRVLSQMGGNF